jgi:hypothetical protein
MRSGCAVPGPPDATSLDATARFRALYAETAAGRSVLAPEARRHPVLLVGGLLTAFYPGYMADTRRHLRRVGVDARRARVNPQGSVVDNAEALRAELGRQPPGRTTVVLAHSKGGVDATAALSLHPALRSRVRALVAVQAPFHGSPVAGDLGRARRVKALVDRLLVGALGGHPGAVADLTVEARRAFLARHPWRGDVPVVSVATTTRSPLSPFALSTAWIRRRYGEENDGLVIARDAVIPGSRVVRLDGVDHAAPVFAGLPGFSPYRPGPLAEALVALALEEA